MCQVTTAGQIETHDTVMGIQQGCVHCEVGRTAESVEREL